MMYEQFENFMSNHPANRYIIAFSGGADSSVLLHLFKRSNRNITAVHVNHNLRGHHSDRDELFCRKCCANMGVPLEVFSVDIAKEAQRRKEGVELTAREVRYELLQKCARDDGLIATAHNLNDQAETMLLALLRGSDTSALAGIPPVRGNIIRPLLEVSRQDIEEYAAAHGVKYVTDNTNFVDIYTRNKIRLNIMPLLIEVNNNAIPHIANACAALRRDAQFLEKLAQQQEVYRCDGGAIRIDIRKLKGLDPAVSSRVIVNCLKKLAITPNNLAVEQLLNMPRRLSLAGGCAYVEGAELVICKEFPDEHIYSVTMMCNSEAIIPQLGATIEIRDEYIADGVEVLATNGKPFTIRSRKPGDRLIFGYGTKKVKDYFIDKKIPLMQRGIYPILEQEGRILAVLGLCVTKQREDGDKVWISLKF